MGEDDDELWTGYLYKRGHIVRSWKRRYFVMDGLEQKMLYYKNQHAIAPLGEHLVKTVEDCKLYHENGFEILTRGGKVCGAQCVVCVAPCCTTLTTVPQPGLLHLRRDRGREGQGNWSVQGQG